MVGSKKLNDDPDHFHIHHLDVKDLRGQDRSLAHNKYRIYIPHLRGGYAPIYPPLPWLLRGGAEGYVTMVAEDI